MFSPARFILRKAAPEEENVVWNLLLPQIRRVMRDPVIYTAAGIVLVVSGAEWFDLSLGGDLDLIYQGVISLAILLLSGTCAWPAIGFRRDMRRRGVIDDLAMAGVSGYQCLDAFSAAFRAAVMLWIAVNLPYHIIYPAGFIWEFGYPGIVAIVQIVLGSVLELALTGLCLIAIFWLLLVLRGWGIMVAAILTIPTLVLTYAISYGAYVAVVALLVICEIVIRRSREWCMAKCMDHLTRT